MKKLERDIKLNKKKKKKKKDKNGQGAVTINNAATVVHSKMLTDISASSTVKIIVHHNENLAYIFFSDTFE